MSQDDTAAGETDTWSLSRYADEVDNLILESRTKEGGFLIKEIIEQALSGYIVKIDGDILLANEKLRQLAKEDPDIFVSVVEEGVMTKFCEYQGKPKKLRVEFTGSLSDIRKRMRNNDPINLDNLSDIEDPVLMGKIIEVKAVFSSNSISYNVPTSVQIQCTSEHDHNRPVTIAIDEEDQPRFVEVKDATRERTLMYCIKKKNSNFNQCSLYCTERESCTMKRRRVRPAVSSSIDGDRFYDQSSKEYKSYDVYIKTKTPQDFEAGQEVRIIGRVIRDPNSARISILVSDVRQNDDQMPSLERMSEIKVLFGGGRIQDKIDYIVAEFEKVTRIKRRGNVTIGALLTFFSPLYITFEERPVPAWVKTTIIGDSTTGKSETVRRLIAFLRSGLIISGETASMAGLGAHASQSSNNQWFVEFGPLVLADARLLAIDGAHALNRDAWSQIAEAEREGRIKLTKAAKGEGLARTRQIKIMNPVDDDLRTTRTMRSFLHPVQSLQNNFNIQSIARQDAAIFVVDDVIAEEINTSENGIYDKKLDCLPDLLRYVWSRKYNVVFREDAAAEILAQATRLIRYFKCDAIPLVTNDQKYKIAKLSSSLAALTCSFNDDFTELIVTKDHVNYITNFITTEYEKAGLHLMAEENHIVVSREDVQSLAEKMAKSLERKDPPPSRGFCDEILVWAGSQKKFTKDQLKSKFDLARDNELNPVTGLLKNEGVIRQERGGFVPTRKAVEIAKMIRAKQSEGVSTLGPPKVTMNPEVPSSHPSLASVIQEVYPIVLVSTRQEEKTLDQPQQPVEPPIGRLTAPNSEEEIDDE
ncbi:MAG TPA: hypothetical protein VJ792_04225 [Candidatus Nitrosotalea sp.]|nr:hypothetical protein [Candidatus Nitrosotalea sp.]